VCGKVQASQLGNVGPGDNLSVAMMNCPFCDLVLNRGQSVVLENDLCLFLQEPQEVLIGSGIIIPKEHQETVFELSEEEWLAIFSLLKQAKQKIDAEHHPDGYTLGWNNGSVAGQEVFHVHLHVIPRYADEPLAGKGIRYWLKQPVNKRRA
jgi:diadenosine tetraphosphate (Ap4A) HIT family hydrolase